MLQMLILNSFMRRSAAYGVVCNAATWISRRRVSARAKRRKREPAVDKYFLCCVGAHVYRNT